MELHPPTSCPKQKVGTWNISKKLAHEKCVADKPGAVTLENVSVSDPNGR